MNVSFVNYDPFEQPVLVLKTAHGDTIGVIGSAENVGIDINYNEVSTIEFDITDRINGEVMPYYDQVVGMRIVELVDIGQFILMNPDEVDTGELRRKKCKCNSLEYEFTYKKITLPENTYRLWDPSGKEITVVSMIMEQMPSWRVEFVSESLQYAYRTFSVSNDNLYNFIKGTVQRSFGCVFEFDTFNRTVRVIDVNADIETRPVLISHENLAKEIDIKENTDNLFTRLDVNGADGVDIRSVNPAGTNKLINLDYFMTKDNFSTALINKYNQWKQSWKNNITPYRYLTIRHSAAIMQKITEQSALLDLKNELTDVENEQAVIIQAIASGLKTQADLNDVNVRIRRKKEEIAAKENEIKNIERQIEDIISEMKAVQNQCSFEAHFTADEMAILTPYIRDGEVSESSFVVTDNASYADAGSGKWVDSLIISITRSATRMTSSTSGSEIYDVRGGDISIENNVTGSIVSAIADVKADGSVVMSIRIGVGLTDGNEFDGASITIVGSLHSNTNNAVQNGDTGDYEISDIEFVIRDAYEYFTLDVSEYDKRSVSQDLMEYGIDVLERLAWPKYSFNVSLANFFAIKDFVDFKNQLRLGAKIDLVAGEDKALSPICTGISMNYNNPSSLTMRFGDTYSANDSKFSLLDLLEKSVSMGKNVDVGKFNYSSFVNSGAKTNIKKFMESALDVAKNAILSSGRQAITWDGAGFRLRKWANDSKTAYDDEQIWMNNNSIMLTDDNWNTAKMAIGKFKDANLGDCWGVVAPMIVGTLIAGSELIIESAKKDGETSVFRMDGDGCRLYNSQMDIHNEAAHITLNPDTGIAIGQYPVCDPETKEVNENNANFWVDSNGNVHMRGTLHGANGEFTGRVTATELIIQSGNNKSQTINEYLSDNIQIGGTNLLRNTATLKKANYSFNNSSDASAGIGFGSTTEDEYGGFHIVCKNQNVRWQVTELPVTPGQSYVMSVQYKINSGSPSIQFQYIFKTAAGTTLHYWDSVNHSQVDTRLEDGWTVMSSVFTVPDNAAIAIMRLAIRTGKDNTAYTCDYNIRRPQLETGNKATDWSPAPEDTDASIEEVRSAVMEITPDYIVQEVRKSTEYKDDLASLKISADEIVSTVRSSKEYKGDIGAKADADYVTENFSTIKQTEDSIESAVDSVQIGGTNLVRCGEEMIGTMRGVIDREWSKSAYCRSGVGIILQPSTSTYNGTHFYTDVTVEPGQYMLSFWCWTHAIDVQPTLRCNLWGKGNGIDHYFRDIQPTANTPKRYEIPIEVTYTSTVNLRLLTWTKFTAGEMYVTDVQLEKGTKATDWSPAPEDTDAAISKVSAQLVIEAGNISANATAIQTANTAAANAQSAADTAKSLANTAQAVANAAQNAANKAQEAADGAVTRITTAEESIDALNGEISSKVTMTEVNTAIGNIALGGTNLIRCAEGTIWVKTGGVDYDWQKSKSCQSGVAAMMLAWSGTHNEVDYESDIDLEPGIYTLSFWSWYASLNVAVTIRPNILGSGYDKYFDQYAFTPNPGVPKRYSFQLEIDYTGRAKFRFVTMTPWPVGEVYFTDLKFEKGNKATEWSPCPYDVDGEISGIAGRVTTAENTISAHSESIKSMVTTTEFGKLQEVVTTQGTSIENSDKEILLLASRTVGGTNLLRNTEILKKANYSFNNSSDASAGIGFGSTTEDEYGGFHVVCNNQNVRIEMGTFPVTPGQTYTMSVRYKINSGSAPIQFQYVFRNAAGTALHYWNSVDHSQISTRVEDGWTVMSSVFTVPPNAAVTIMKLAIRTGKDNTAYTCDYNILRPKLEAGSMPTDWTPSPYDPSNGLDTGTSSSVKVRITSDTFDVDVPGTDGDFTLNRTGARIPVVNSDVVYAQNLSYRYNGPNTLYVNPNATSAQIAAGNYFKSLTDACAYLSYKILYGSVSITVQGDSYGVAELHCIGGGGRIDINGGGHKLIGSLYLYDCAPRVYVNSLTVSRPSNGAKTYACAVTNCNYISMVSVVLDGNSGTYAIIIEYGARLWLENVELYNATHLLYALYGTDVTSRELKGGGGTNFAWANGCILKMEGTRPDGEFVRSNAAMTYPDDPNTLTVNYGTAQPSVPVIQTATYNYTTSDSYRGGWSYFSDEDIHQGYDGGTIYGTIWFDASTIKSALSGKTIKQVSLRLHMAKGVGREVAVSVQLYGTNMAYSGRSGQPALTTSYGTIGTTEPDVTNEITIPTAVISDIVSGKIQALVLKSDDTTTYKDRFYSQNYAKFFGSTSATTANCPRLTVVYQ